MSIRDRPDFEGETVTIGSDTATIGEFINAGDEGYVYGVEGSPDDVVKIFKQDRRGNKEPKIEAMIKNAPKDTTYEEKGVRSLIWPQNIVSEKSSGLFWGYQMPRVATENTVSAFQYADDPTYLNSADTDPDKRFRVARNLAIMVHNIHQKGHAMGDFNDQNIKVRVDDDEGKIALIDCDSFWIRDEDQIHRGTTYAPRYSPPQKLGNSLTSVQKGDRFCLGIHIFQFLMGANHPYQTSNDSDDAEFGDWADRIAETPFPYQETAQDVRPPAALQQRYNQLPTKIRDLFKDCFGHGSKDATMGRPRPIEWVNALGSSWGGTESSDAPGELENPFENNGNGGHETAETDTDDSGHENESDDAPGNMTNPFGTVDGRSSDTSATGSKTSGGSGASDDAPGSMTNPFSTDSDDDSDGAGSED